MQLKRLKSKKKSKPLKKARRRVQRDTPTSFRSFVDDFEKYHLEIVLPGLPKILSNSSQGSWRLSHFAKKQWKIKAQDAAILAGLPKTPLTRAHLTLTRFSTVRPDQDNMRISFKSAVDGLVQAGVIEDDHWDVIGEPSCNWVKSTMKGGHIEITVEEL